MEIVRVFQVQTISMIRFVVIFLMSIGSSSYGQSGHTDKYIVNSYFEKYDSLMQQEFDNFIASEIPLGLCRVILDENHVVVSDLHRDVTGQGSHRRLSSSIKFKFWPKPQHESCEVVIFERLPSGVFADPFEVHHLIQRGVLTDAAVFGDTNLELPSFRSNRSVVEIHMSIASKALSSYEEEDDLEINLELPLHARYPPLGLSGFSRVEFGKPDLFICCSLDGNVANRSCAFMPTNHNADNSILWEIPCGIKEHAVVVTAVTFGFAIVTAMLIVLASLCYSDSQGSIKSKVS